MFFKGNTIVSSDEYYPEFSQIDTVINTYF